MRLALPLYQKYPVDICVNNHSSLFWVEDFHVSSNGTHVSIRDTWLSAIVLVVTASYPRICFLKSIDGREGIMNVHDSHKG